MTKETLHHALGIDDNRNIKLGWHVDEIMNTKCTKAEGMQKIAAIESTPEEKVYMGYMLAKRIVVLKTPRGMRHMLDTVYNL